METIDPKKSFRWNYEQGVSKEILIKYYLIDSEEKWNKLMESIKDTKLREDAKAFRKKMIVEKDKEEK